jgi:hypothetical protein
MSLSMLPNKSPAAKGLCPFSLVHNGRIVLQKSRACTLVSLLDKRIVFRFRFGRGGMVLLLLCHILLLLAPPQGVLAG